MRDVALFLKQRQALDLYRQRTIRHSAQMSVVMHGDKELISFASNDYLGLANDVRLAKAMQEGIQAYGIGAGASALLGGYQYPHHALEQELAEFIGHERVLLFSCGYLANLSVISSLLARHDRVFIDRLCHASIIDGVRLSGARPERYQHCDMADLKQRLRASQTDKQSIVVSDGVFSMNGDIVPLPRLLRLAKQYNALALIDDAHGFGMLGQNGGGSVSRYGLCAQQVPILVGGFAKAFGCYGGFVAGSEELIEFLIQKAHGYIYTTAMPAALACACRESLRIAIKEDWRREKLQALIVFFRDKAEQLGMTLMPSMTAIQSLVVGDNLAAIQLSQALLQAGFYIPAIRPPTVPQGSAGLRINLTAAHTQAQINDLLTTLAKLSGKRYDS